MLEKQKDDSSLQDGNFFFLEFNSERSLLCGSFPWCAALMSSTFEQYPKDSVALFAFVFLFTDCFSERADPSYCKDRITEGANINKSLVTLGIVISTLGNWLVVGHQRGSGALESNSCIFLLSKWGRYKVLCDMVTFWFGASKWIFICVLEHNLAIIPVLSFEKGD